MCISCRLCINYIVLHVLCIYGRDRWETSEGQLYYVHVQANVYICKDQFMYLVLHRQWALSSSISRYCKVLQRQLLHKSITCLIPKKPERNWWGNQGKVHRSSESALSSALSVFCPREACAHITCRVSISICFEFNSILSGKLCCWTLKEGVDSQTQQQCSSYLAVSSQPCPPS